MNNPRMTTKERNLVKGALRRVFSRSELRKTAIEASIIPGYSDLSRPKVKTWCLCSQCRFGEAKSYVVVDHIDPVVPTHCSLEEMSWDDVIYRMWCALDNLQVLCQTCHKSKTSIESKERKRFKKEKTKDVNRKRRAPRKNRTKKRI